MIKRDFYLNQIIDRMWDGRIKVITGIRRCVTESERLSVTCDSTSTDES